MTDKSFRTHPEYFNRRSILVRGKVKRIFGNKFSEKLKRKITHLRRKLFGSKAYKHRHIHQRFLIAGPELRGGKMLMIHHNTSFGKVKLKRGCLVEVKGIYVHRQSYTRGFFGIKRKTFYGLVHHTHEPVGYVRVLEI